MSKIEPKRNRGRPRKPFDRALVRRLAGVGLTVEEIAMVCGVSKSTVLRHASRALNRGRANMTISLRRAQFRSAKRGNVAMLIWLGKQYLGQRDRQEVTTEHGGTLRIVERIEPDRPDVANGD